MRSGGAKLSLPTFKHQSWNKSAQRLSAKSRQVTSKRCFRVLSRSTMSWPGSGEGGFSMLSSSRSAR